MYISVNFFNKDNFKLYFKNCNFKLNSNICMSVKLVNGQMLMKSFSYLYAFLQDKLFRFMKTYKK